MFMKRLRTKAALGRAWADAARQNYGQALEAILKFVSDAEEELPSESYPIEFNLFYADLLSRCGNKIESYRVAKWLTDGIKNGRFDGGISDEEKKYVLYVCKWILSTLSEFKDSESFILAKDIKILWGDLRTNSVRSEFRKMFPVSIEHGHQLDSYMRDNE